jgi:AcrR family transcriptional regulator
MDRRQKKSREAIFRAFTRLLSEKNVQHITVGQIIDLADVGRATFYAHFETKEHLLKALCEELFCHLFDSLNDRRDHRHIFECDAPESVFEHLFYHLQNNDNQLLCLLSGENRQVFMPYFIAGLRQLIQNQIAQFPKPSSLPDDFWRSHVTAAFVQTLQWWVANGMAQTPKQITAYFELSVKA